MRGITLFIGLAVLLSGRTAFAQETATTETAEQAGAAAVEQPVEAAAPVVRPEPAPTLSPLHTFLGIDQRTGDFLPPAEVARRKERWARGMSAAPTETPATTAETSTSLSPPAATTEPDATPAIADTTPATPAPTAPTLPTSVDDAEAVVRKVHGQVADVLQGVERGDLTPIGAVFRVMEDHPAYRAMYRWGLVLTGICFAVPAFALLFSGLTGWYLTNGEDRLDEFDHRYQRRRFIRKMAMAAIFAVLALLVPLGSYFVPWWEQPGTATALWGTVVFLALTVYALHRAERAAAVWYDQAVLRELRRGQLALRQELDDLRKRLPGQRTLLGG